MDADIVGSILQQVNTLGSDVVDLLQSYQARAYDAFWQGDAEARLYCGFAKRLIGAGHPARAYELVQDGIIYHKQNLELRYLAALALVRSGNVRKPTAYADDLLRQPGFPPKLRVDVVSLKGRLKKDQYERTADPALKRQLAAESAALCASAYALPEANSFPGINAATMWLLAGQSETARALAARVTEQVTQERRAPGREHDYWLLATLGEACIILGKLDQALLWYRQAIEHAQGQTGDVVSMRRQVLLLAQVIQGLEGILEAFNLGNVVVFAGHMIDHPDRLTDRNAAPRFPPDPELEQAVAQAIREQLDDLNATIGYASAACGSDILFGEQLRARGQERHVECHIVLPFALHDFYSTSVDFGVPEMQAWRTRCDALLARPTEVHYATTEPFWGDRVLFEWVNTVTQGLALTHAARLGVKAYALVVLDRDTVPAGAPGALSPSAAPATTPVGGTAYFLEHWQAGGRETRVINLAELRARLKATPSAPPGIRAPVPVTTSPGAVPRQVKAMLFADVKNYSKLSDAQAPSFLATFRHEVAKVLAASQSPPEFRNTWGDGLYLVFGSVGACADFAMRLLERLGEVDWASLGLPADTAVRMGIHAGPVYPMWDEIIGRQNFFGSHVNRAARIEPVTTPGAAFTSAEFAAAITVDSRHDFLCEFIGVEWLAKEYDRCALYQLARR